MSAPHNVFSPATYSFSQVVSWVMPMVVCFTFSSEHLPFVSTEVVCITWPSTFWTHLQVLLHEPRETSRATAATDKRIFFIFILFFCSQTLWLIVFSPPKVCLHLLVCGERARKMNKSVHSLTLVTKKLFFLQLIKKKISEILIAPGWGSFLQGELWHFPPPHRGENFPIPF